MHVVEEEQDGSGAGQGFEQAAQRPVRLAERAGVLGRSEAGEAVRGQPTLGVVGERSGGVDLL